MITCYLKPTNYCNVGCSHCYLPEEIRANKDLMTRETLNCTATLLSEMRNRLRKSAIHIIFHGGEPLTVSREWYGQAFDAFDDKLSSGYTTSMQTSLIPLKEWHLDLINNLFNGHVGSSIDFSQRRINNSVEEYHQLWMRKVMMAREAGIMVIPGVVPTLNERGREEEIVDWFIERDFPAFNIDRYNAYMTYFPDRPSNLQHAHFLIGLFNAMISSMKKRGWAPVNGAIKASITGVLMGYGGDRWGGGCMNDFIVVGPDGMTNNCPDKHSREMPFSNVHQGCHAFMESPQRRASIRHQIITHKQPYCSDCEFQSWCGSGCPITPNGSAEGEEGCSGYYTYLAHVRDTLKDKDMEKLAIAYTEQSLPSIVERSLQYGGERRAACRR